MKAKFSKKQIVLFSIIILACTLAIGLSIYVQFSKNSNKNNNPEENDSDIVKEKLKEDFDDIFSNSIDISKSNMNNIEKVDDSKELVYTSYEKIQVFGGRYDIDVAIPTINIAQDKFKDFNQNIIKIFQDKATSILSGNANNDIYRVKYQAYINEGIFSLIMQSTLKDGTNPQRVIIKAYNYDLENSKEITLEDIIISKNLDRNTVSEKIKEEIRKENEAAQALQDIGYSVYMRDLRSDIYDIENTYNFFIGKDGHIYVIYAYGNTRYTSERDIIILK